MVDGQITVSLDEAERLSHTRNVTRTIHSQCNVVWGLKSSNAKWKEAETGGRLKKEPKRNLRTKEDGVVEGVCGVWGNNHAAEATSSRIQCQWSAQLFKFWEAKKSSKLLY